MATTTMRKPASLRLNSKLLDLLKERAKASNRSFNNFVESVLLDAMYYEPNATTIAAIEEARSGQCEGVIDTSSLENFMKSLE